MQYRRVTDGRTDGRVKYDPLFHSGRHTGTVKENREISSVCLPVFKDLFMSTRLPTIRPIEIG